MVCEEGIGPTDMIARCSTETWSLIPLAQDCSQPPPDKSVNVLESCSMGLLEVAKPAPEDGIEFLDDGFQATTASTTGLLSDLIPKCLAAFRTYPTPTGLKPIPQKFKPLTLLHAVAHLGFVRM